MRMQVRYLLVPCASLCAALGLAVASAQVTATPTPAAATTTAPATTTTVATPTAPPVTVTPPAGATPRLSATPAPAGTPWPAPTDLRVLVTSHPLDANNVPVPPDRRQPDDIVVSWLVLPGYTGVFEVERALVPRGATGRAWERIATVPATAASGGRASTPETVPFLDSAATQRCYRVRTVINGETGPYSAEACTVLPPTSGGGSPLITVTPVPPGTGNGVPSQPAAGWFEMVCAGIAALGIAAAVTVAASARVRSR